MDLPILNNPAPRPMAGAATSFHPFASRPLPMSVAEMRERGWDEVDVVFVTGDAYIDHPSFAMAILGRVLEAAGFRVASSASPTGGIATPGGRSAGRGCSSRSAPATWIR